MDSGFEYATSHPMETAEDYPFVDADFQYTQYVPKCAYSASQGTGKITGHVDVQKYSANALKAAIAK